MVTNSHMDKAEPGTVHKITPLILPALIIGIFCSLLLVAVALLANLLEKFWWIYLPLQIGISAYDSVWIFLVLVLTGILVGITVWKVPGHAGPDPATVSLVDKPLSIGVVPGLIITVILMLAGGVSLGPENPIMAANIAIVVFIGSRLSPKQEKLWVTFAIAGTVGALFGTPLAAALMISEASASRIKDKPILLWDRMVAPMFAAGAGSLTTHFLGGPSLSVEVPAYGGLQIIDVFTGSLIALVSASVGLIAIYIYPYSHKFLAKLRHPTLMIIVGGILLGILGIIGGEVTLFKGLDQMKSLTTQIENYSIMALVLIIVVKLLAIVIAAASGFRGGRIFPALFVGVAIGLLAYRIFPEIPLSLAVSCGALGILLAITRQGWLALFMALATVPDMALMPVLTLIVLPVWLLVTGKAHMEIPKDQGVIYP